MWKPKGQRVATAMLSRMAKTRIQVASDLHLEFRAGQCEEIVTPTNASVLILAGDIGSPLQSSYAEFIRAMAARYPRVIVVPGNHEYYTTEDGADRLSGFSMDESEAAMRAACARVPNVTFLSDESTVIDGTRYIGSTLWSRIHPVLVKQCKQGMNDYRRILVEAEKENDDDDSSGTKPPTKRLLTVDDTNALHAASVEFIEQEINAASAEGQAAVVVTHHAPSFRSIHRDYALSPLTCAFASDLEERLVRPPVALWVHGHTHRACDYNVADTRDKEHDGDSARTVRVINNPAGYPGELTGFRSDLVVEI
jgi:predicted phosphodiesterase